jgi:CotH kinase protein/Lamin Tail Domain
MNVGEVGRRQRFIGVLLTSALAAGGCGGGKAGGGVGSATGTSHVNSGVDGQLSINELMADNVLTAKDDRGTASPWIEIYNPTGEDVPLAGYALTDDFSNPKKSVLGQGVVVPAHGHLLLWADGEPAVGAAHLGILLSAGGGSVGLARPDGSFIQRLTYGAQQTDLSAAREPDGSTSWVTEWNVSPGAANPAGGQPAAPQASGDGPEMIPAAGDVSDRVLGYDLIPQFDLQISDAGIASLRASPNSWVQATIVYQGRSYGPVGVNLKGTASFQTIDQKPGFRVSATQFAKGARFFGLKKFLLNNMGTDPSMVHERLAYWIARQIGGVPASRCNHSWVTLNGAPLGLYATVEEPRSQMMAYSFTDATGGVYTINYADFTSALVANFQYDDGKQDTTLINQTTAALATAPADAAIATAGRYVNMHQFARFWAICVLTGHWGGWPYAATNEPAGANAEVYADPTSNQLYFIPTGINDALASGDYDFINQVKSVLARNCAASSSCYQDFANQLLQMDAQATQLGWSAERDRVVAQIAAYVQMDTRKPYSNDDVAMYQQQTGYFITGRDTYIRKYLAPLASP